MDYFLPLRNIWNRVREFPRASTTAAGITWMSRYLYGYHRLMLEDLAPGAPATQRWPLYRQPPPHFLVGYQYLVRTCNDYVFDSRAFSRLRYSEVVQPGLQTVNWSLMANCTYTINTGAYHRFVDMDDFQDTLTRVQQAILAERVVADLALVQPLRGVGVTRMEDSASASDDIERLMHDYYKNLSRCQGQARAWPSGSASSKRDPRTWSSSPPSAASKTPTSITSSATAILTASTGLLRV